MTLPNSTPKCHYLASLLLLIAWLYGACSQQLFDSGKEYKYSYFGLFTTGTEEPVSQASSYMLLGSLTVQGNSDNSFTAKLGGMQIAMYNGRWSYFPVPQFGFFQDDRLASLEEPFKIYLTEEGKFKSLTMNDQEPEFASNLKRGLATYLQMNFTGGFDSLQIFKDEELTTMGQCETAYEVMPSTSGAIVGKFRNHADCPDIPKRIRQGPRIYYPCSMDNTRDILNSTSYTSYNLALDGNNPTINSVTVISSILYWPFTSGGQFLYTWFNVTLALIDSGPIKVPINGPENPESHEDLSFAFEQSDYQDPEEETPDIKTVEPFYFHQTVAETEPQAMEALVEKAKQAVDKVAESIDKHIDDFQDDFHSNSPTTVSRAISYLDHSSLKSIYAYYKENHDKDVRMQLFMDGLIMAGTAASTTTIRDLILKESSNENTLARIIPLFPNYIQTPSEALVKEFDPVFDLLSSATLSKNLKRILELSLATLVSRGCERNLCTTSGLLEKYINYFENKFNVATHFDDQTIAVLGLRNLQIGTSLDKVLSIALGNVPATKVTRVQAIWSLQPLQTSFQDQMLRVFYNRTESGEIRTSVFGLLMNSKPEKRILHEIAYFMWTETCPQTLNIVRSTLMHLSKAVGPCTKISSYARTILKYLPPGSVDPTRTHSYATEYFDEATGIGRSFYTTVQKSGTTALPVSIYLGASQTIGGYSSSPVGLFIRFEGVGNFLTDAMMSNSDEQAQNILKMLSDLRVKVKKDTPLRLEFTVIYLGRVIYHQGLDEEIMESTIQKAIRQVQTVLGTLKSNTNFLWERSLLVGETLYQQPLEIGLPVSIYTSGSIFNYFKFKVSPLETGNHKSLELEALQKQNVYVTTTISNHVPVLGTKHTAGLLRSMKLQNHRHLAITLKMPNGWNYTAYPPSYDMPFAIQTHATAFTSVSNDSPISDDADKLLHKSCSNCESFTMVSSGPGITQNNEVISIPTIDGISSGVKKFMCEKHISRTRFLQKLQDFFGSKGKNAGVFDTSFSKMGLGFLKLYDHFFFWPNPERCGFQIYFKKNPGNSSFALEKIEGKLSLEVPTSHDQKGGEIKLHEILKLKYEGPLAPPQKTIASFVKIGVETLGFQKFQIKYSVDGQSNGGSIVGCVDVLNYVDPPKTDPLGYEGDNEPKVNQTFTVKIGKVPGSVVASESLQCTSDHVDIAIIGKAERSADQIAAAQGHSQELSYILCQMEIQSGHWPKRLMPPTSECYKMVLDQTSLRKVNLTIKYKVSEEVRKRWTRPLLFIGNFLSPFLTDPDQDKVHHEQHQHKQNDQYEGEVEIDINLKNQDPLMDIHFIGPSDERHYHDIDFDLVPNFLKVKPSPGRFSPMTQFLRKAGFIGSCAFTSSYLVTFDNLKYAAKFTECETLVAADCSETPKFAIYSQITSSKLSTRISWLRDEFTISDDDTITSKANGTIAFDNNGEYSIHGATFKKRGKEITLKSLLLGVEVRYVEGDLVQVILDSRYRGQTCGLCGNFDTTAQNDMQGPTSPSCSLTSVVDAWTLKAGTCKQIQSVC